MTDAEAIFRAKTNAEWLTLLDAAGVPAGPVRFVEELFDHPQVLENNMAADVSHRDLGTVRMAGPLGVVQRNAPPRRRPCRRWGNTPTPVLHDLGYESATIDRWRSAGIIL